MDLSDPHSQKKMQRAWWFAALCILFTQSCYIWRTKCRNKLWKNVYDNQYTDNTDKDIQWKFKLKKWNTETYFLKIPIIENVFLCCVVLS